MTGIGVRSSSRVLSQYAFEDFAIRQVALLLNNTNDEAKFANRSLVSPALYAFIPSAKISLQSYRNIWDPDVESDGFRGEESFALSVCALLTGIVMFRFHAETLSKRDFRSRRPRGLLG